MLFLSREEVDALVSTEQAVAVLHAALLRYSDRTVLIPDARRLSLRVPAGGPGAAGMYCFSKVCYLGFAGVVGFRVVAAGPDPSRATRFVLLCDGRDGSPVALIAEHGLYQVRVAALAAIAVRHLAARRPALTIGLVGAGALARAILAALLAVVHPARVLVTSRRAESRLAFAERMKGAVSAADSVRDAVAPADIVVTATTATAPILEPEWIKPGALLYLVGGGNEADIRVYRRATKIVVSDWRECMAREDVARMVQEGQLSEADVHASLHEVVQGVKAGRADDEEVILVRAPGTVFHDVALAHHVYLRAVETGRGRRLDG